MPEIDEAGPIAYRARRDRAIPALSKMRWIIGNSLRIRPRMTSVRDHDLFDRCHDAARREDIPA
ncbi:hypothetical protein [Salinisphaera sp.]|uniref:hypothetical protein n=1 Tax=Salinisphaera sp. TaxID=1914330 RepID=UPI002D78C0DC|nr:hypothetical protein [Salinisphaera sp.]HET7314613.1 hypothetical protein [Salinisphaera sp.]